MADEDDRPDRPMVEAMKKVAARLGRGGGTAQNITDPRLGPRGLDLMAQGQSAPRALEALKTEEPRLHYRQLALIDGAGRAASFSGAHTLGTRRVATGPGVIAAGNLLASHDVPAAMIEGSPLARAR